MKRILAIGDIHGRKKWEALQSEVADRIIFLGDYFDSYDGISQADQIKNFENILAWKRQEPAKVVLLFGNHDYHYLVEGLVQYTGYRANPQISQIVQTAVNNRWLQLLHLEDGYLFSHAGISSRWLELIKKHENLSWEEIPEILYTQPGLLNFGVFGYSYSDYGDDPEQGPLWIRPRSLDQYPLPAWIQVVGHTVQTKIQIGENLILIDSPNGGEVLEIVNQKPNIYLCQNYTS
jgi:predicted phosphodiesterase